MNKLVMERLYKFVKDRDIALKYIDGLKDKYEVKGFYRANGRALAMEADEGMVKLVINENDLIIGCHAYGTHAADIVQEVTCLMNLSATRSQLSDIVHIHPTVSEVLQDLAR